MAGPPYVPPDGGDDELDNTQPTGNRTRVLPPVPPAAPHGTGHVRARDRRAARMQKQGTDELPLAPEDREARRAAERRARRRPPGERKNSGLFLPAWSVVLMLVVVFGVAAMIVVAVLLAGNPTVGDGEPRFVIITAMPSETPAGGPPNALAVPTEPGGRPALPTFALEGPLLPTVGFTPTPSRIALGGTVRVVNVGLAGLNMRQEASISSARLRVAEEGETFTVIEGPQASENFTWWRLRSISDPTIVGWAVENDGESDVLESVAS